VMGVVWWIGGGGGGELGKTPCSSKMKREMMKPLSSDIAGSNCS
jgi:hypothetical protein